MNIEGNFPTYEKQEAIKQGVDNIALQIENKDAGKVMKSKVFETPGSFTWTVPDGVTEVYLTGCGGGGSGAHGPIDSTGGYYGPSGGGAHYVEYYPVLVTPGQSVTVTVGIGGGAVRNGSTNGINGNAGGTTSFGVYFSLPGGGGGNYSTRQGGMPGGPLSGKGGNGLAHSNTTSIGGLITTLKGGDCGPYTGGTLGSYNSMLPGQDGGPGSGGGGVGVNSEGVSSGKGGDGFLLVQWWE